MYVFVSWVIRVFKLKKSETKKSLKMSSDDKVDDVTVFRCTAICNACVDKEMCHSHATWISVSAFENDLGFWRCGLVWLEYIYFFLCWGGGRGKKDHPLLYCHRIRWRRENVQVINISLAMEEVAHGSSLYSLPPGWNYPGTTIIIQLYSTNIPLHTTMLGIYTKA